MVMYGSARARFSKVPVTTGPVNLTGQLLGLVFVPEVVGASHNAGPSGLRPVELTKENSSKVNFQPDRSVPFTFQPKFRLHHSEMGLETRIFVNGTAHFDRTGPTSRGGPKYSGRTEPKRTRNFRKFCLNEKHPVFSTHT